MERRISFCGLQMALFKFYPNSFWFYQFQQILSIRFSVLKVLNGSLWGNFGRFSEILPFSVGFNGKILKESLNVLTCLYSEMMTQNSHVFFCCLEKKMFDQIGASRAVWLTCRGFLFFVQWNEVQRAEVETTGGHDRWSRGRLIRPDSSRLRAASERRCPFIDQCGRRSCKCSFIRLLWICMAWTWIVGLLFASGSSGWIHNYDHDPRFVEFSEI